MILALIIACILVIAIIAFVFWQQWPALAQWFRDSETIFLARAQMLGAILLGGLNVMNWTPLLDTGLTAAQRWSVAVVLFAQGLITEVARRLRPGA